MTPKTCILCKHMRFDCGEDDLSDATPGYDWSSRCGFGRWLMSGTNVTTLEYRHNLLSANTCPQFEEAEIPQ